MALQLFYMKKDRIIRKCLNCADEFETRPYLVEKRNRGKFCSQECYWKNKIGKRRNIIERECLICKKIFYRNFYYFSRALARGQNGAGKYCSRACLGIANQRRQLGKKHWNWKGGITPRNLSDKRYSEWRLKVLERDRFQCINCDSTINLRAHHKKSWKKFPEFRYDVSNGMTLCQKCHVARHMEEGTWGRKKIVKSNK